MKLKKVLYVLFSAAIIAVAAYNVKIGNYPGLNLLSFDLALSSESGSGGGGESDVSNPPKCTQKYRTELDPLNAYSCNGQSSYGSHNITNYIYYCDLGANTSSGCKSITIKKGHDCNSMHCESHEEVLQKFAEASCTYKCPKQ